MLLVYNITDYYYDYKDNLELGDKLKVIGTFEVPSNNTIPNIFNYRKYLYNNQIYYLVDADEIKIVSKNTNIFYYIKILF